MTLYEGTNLADVLTGSIENDELYGYEGDDSLSGDEGNDVLVGGLGADTIDGGTDSENVIAVVGGINILEGQELTEQGEFTIPTIGYIEGEIADGGYIVDKDGNQVAIIEDIGGGVVQIRGLIATFTYDLSEVNGEVQILTDDGLHTVGRIIEGQEHDLASYGDSAEGVDVSLASGTGLGGTAEGDSLVNVEDLQGSNYDDVLTGDGGSNVLSGSDGLDTINGGAGNDFIAGGLGADAIDGGTGTDTAVYRDSNEAVTAYLDGTAGIGGDAEGDIITNTENLWGSNFDDTLNGDGQDNSIKGLEGADVISGGAGSDSLFGNEGNDTLNGDAGDDIISSGLGADIIDGGDGTDTATYGFAEGAVTAYLDGTTGTQGEATGDVITNTENMVGSDFGDTLYGDAGANFIDGEMGDDTIYGGDGADKIAGNYGNDTIYGEGGDDFIRGNEGADIIDGGAGNDNLQGGDDNDTIRGGDGGDYIKGEAGDDTIEGGAGMDYMVGGDGIDTLTYENASAGVNATIIDGERGLVGDAFWDLAYGFENLTGSPFDDTLEGNASANVITGGAGVDTITYENSTAAVDVSIVDGILNSGGYGEGDALYGFYNLTGSNYDDILTGNDMNNVIEGLAGADNIDGGNHGDFTIYKQGGDEYWTLEAGGDTIDYSKSDSAITASLVDGSVGSGGHAEGDIINGIEHIIGSDYNDHIVANSLSNVIDGGDGIDTVDYSFILPYTLSYSPDVERGVYIFIQDYDNINTPMTTSNNGRDVFYNIENVIGTDYLDYIFGNDKDNIINAGLSSDYVDGGAGDDIIYSTGSGNVFALMDGSYLIGGTGSDTIYGSEASDKIYASDYDQQWGGVYDNDTSGNFIYAGDGDDNIYDSGQNDLLDAGAGNDTISSWGGSDTIDGGDGIDALSYYASSNPDVNRAPTSSLTIYLDGTVCSGSYIEGATIISPP